MSELRGCILGCITVTSANNQVDFVEDPGGAATARTTQIPDGDYFPDSDEAQEDLCRVLELALNDVSSGFTVTFSGTNGTVTIANSGFEFQLLTSASYSDSIFLSLGYVATDPTSAAQTLTASNSPLGSFWPMTPDLHEELMADSKWMTTRKGKSSEGATGALYTRRFGITETRTLQYGPVRGTTSYINTGFDVERGEVCFRDHWSKGYRVRVYTNTRTITLPPDDNAIFDGWVINEAFSPKRYQGYEELDWWEFSLELSKYVSDPMSYPISYMDGLRVSNNSTHPDHQVDISTGYCRSSDNTTDITVSSTLTADIAVAGANGLDTGAAANSFYYVWVIKALATNTVASLLSLSSTSPTMPSGYTKKRRVGFVVRVAGSFLVIAQTGTGTHKKTTYNEVYTVTRTLNGGGAAAWADIDNSALVPPTATEVEGWAYLAGSAAADRMELRAKGDTVSRIYMIGWETSGVFVMPPGTTQCWQYQITTGAVGVGSLYILAVWEQL